MSYPGYRRPPTIRNLVLGGMAVVALFAFFSVSPEALKLVGALFLFIPEKLGIVQQATGEEAHIIALDSYTTQLDIAQPGRYAVYTADMHLLRAALNATRAWLLVSAQETGEQVPVSVVDRGLRPYDTPVVRGRPIFTFEIETPGAYEVSHPRRDASAIMSIVPDYTTGHETAVALSYLAQMAFIAGLVGVFYHRRGRTTRSRIKAWQREKRSQSEAFWRARKEKAKSKEKRGN